MIIIGLINIKLTNIVEMSCLIYARDFTFEVWKRIAKEVTVKSIENNYGPSTEVSCYAEDPEEKDGTLIPFSYYYGSISTQLKTKFPNEGIIFPRANEKLKFMGKLNSVQEEVKPQVYEILNRTRSIMISLYCGAGKTALAIYICSQLKYKVCVLAHRLNLLDQWMYAIKKFCPMAKTQLLSSYSTLDPAADFYVINVSNVQKKQMKEFEQVGILIIDEAHTICTENMSQALFWFRPKYTIGLTATPDRTDGMGKILTLHFGPEIVERKMYRSFNAYIIETGCTPVTESNEKTGKLDWNKTIESQCLNEDRNMLIVNIIRYLSTRNFLVLCKRIEQSNYLYRQLKAFDEDVEIYVSTQKKFNVESRILISTFSKAGVGFDSPKLDAMIMASDVCEGIEQYMGRVFRDEKNIPMIIDLADKVYRHHPLNKHLGVRKQMYESKGGVIKSFTKTFPKFAKFCEEEILI